MTNKMKKFLSIIVAAIILLCVPVTAFAQENQRNGYNVIIAMDASGSLQETDPNNYRYDAVNFFIQLLANKNNKLGCVSFSSDISNQNKLTPINTTADKQGVYDALTSTNVGGWTNIGSALQNAVADIKANGDSDKPSVIVFFSDGNTEMPSDKEQTASLDAKADAVQMARDNGIAIYSVCLNADGRADKKEMEQISKATGGEFVEIKKAEDLQAVLTTFYSMIYGSSIQNIIDNTFDSTGSVVVPFEVPGTGVEEINVILYGKAKDIVVAKPDNTTAKCEIIEAETFSFVKISEGIVPGEWSVKVSGVPGDKVKIDLLFNSDLSVVTSINPDKNSFNPDDTIRFEATLQSSKGNAAATENGFAGTLKLRDKYGEVIKELLMTNENGKFFVETKLEEDTYKYSVAVQGYSITKESEVKGPITVSSRTISQGEEANNAPVPVQNPYEVKINLWPFKDNRYTINVTELATDDQTEPLEYIIESSSFIENEDYKFDGEKIEMIDYSLSKGEFLINVYDMYGETCQVAVKVTTRNIGMITVILLIVLAVIVVAAIMLVIFRNKILFFNGSLTITSQQTWQSFTQEHPGKGQYKLSRFVGLDNIGLDPKKSYFQATGGKYVYFCTDKPITTGGAKTTKKLKIENGRSYIVALPSKDGMANPAISVQFNSKNKGKR